MKTPLILKLALLLATLTVAPSAFANDDEGGDHSGGGNTINSKLVEDYAVDYADLKGRAEFEKKLAELHELAPELADKITRAMKNATFYVIPKDIDPLTMEKTGLHFQTEQGAIQEGREIFINAGGNDMRDDAAAGRMLMHEGLMQAQTKKESRAVRQVLVKLYSKEATQLDLANALSLNRFGTYFPKESKQAISSWSRWLYLGFVQGVVKDADEACANTKNDVSRLRRVLSDGFPDSKYENDDVLNLSRYHLDSLTTAGYISPFHATSPYGAIGTMHTIDNLLGTGPIDLACMHSADKLPREVCAELNSYLDDYAYNNKEPTFDHEKEIRSETFHSATLDFKNGASRGLVGLYQYLERNPSFLNLQAISMDPKVVREWQLDSYPSNDRVKSDLRRIEQRQSTLDRSDKAAMRRLLCNSVTSLRRDLDQLAADEDANHKAGIFTPSWRLKRDGENDDHRRLYKNDDDQWVDPAL